MADRVLTGRYRVGQLLGRGGMAEVYEGWDERLQRPVAVKMLRPDMAANPDIRARFEVEARAAARLHHPNVVSVFDTGEDSGDPFMVMELVSGESMADRVRTGPVDPEWVCRVAGDVLAALGAAHAAGLVHRDVKPGNVLLASDGHAKVADFGIAKSLEAVGGDPTSTGLLLGTPAYLAPERINGEPATPRSDLYSVGVVLYEALAGVKPFVGSTPLAVASAIATVPPPPLDEVRPGLSPVLVAAIERAMAKDPADRPGSAAEMAADLGLPAEAEVTLPLAAPGAVAGVAGVAVGTPPGPGLVARSLAAPRTLGLGLAAAAVAVLFVVLVAFGGGDGGGAGGDRVDTSVPTSTTTTASTTSTTTTTVPVDEKEEDEEDGKGGDRGKGRGKGDG